MNLNNYYQHIFNGKVDKNTIIKLIKINNSLKILSYQYKKLRSEKYDIESIIDIFHVGDSHNIKIFNYLMRINQNIKDLSFNIYKLRNHRIYIIYKNYNYVSKKKPSGGELVIIQILKKLKDLHKIYYYEWEKILPIKLKNNLRADLFLIDSQLKRYIIEYDGPQHYHQSNYFNKNKSNFIISKKRDELKNSYANDNNIKILRIPYTYNKTKIKNAIYKLLNI